MMKRSIQKEDKTIVGTLKYIKQIITDIKGEIDSNTITVGDFNTPFTSRIDHPDRRSI